MNAGDKRGLPKALCKPNPWSKSTIVNTCGGKYFPHAITVGTLCPWTLVLGIASANIQMLDLRCQRPFIWSKTLVELKNHHKEGDGRIARRHRIMNCLMSAEQICVNDY